MVKVQVQHANSLTEVYQEVQHIVVCKCESRGLDGKQYLYFICVYVPKQLVLQARLSHSEIDDCNFDTHLKVTETITLNWATPTQNINIKRMHFHYE